MNNFVAGATCQDCHYRRSSVAFDVTPVGHYQTTTFTSAYSPGFPSNPDAPSLPNPHTAHTTRRHHLNSPQPSSAAASTANMPSATGQSWEKYQKNFADDEVEEKKITPLTDEYDCT